MVNINLTQCTGCGLCVKDCIAASMSITASGKAECGPGCIGCGHCVAICPEQAASISSYGDDPLLTFSSKEDYALDPLRLINWLKFRRSVRAFQPKEVEQAHLDLILEAGRIAPSEANSQNVRYIVITKQLNQFKDIAIKALYRQANDPNALQHPSSPAAKFGNFWINMYHSYMKDPTAIEALTFGAPMAILIVSPSEVNGSLAAADMRIMSDALGMGSFYSAFIRAASQEKNVADFIGLQDNEIVVTAMLLGYPNVTYRRTVPRKPLNATYL